MVVWEGANKESKGVFCIFLLAGQQGWILDVIKYISLNCLLWKVFSRKINFLIKLQISRQIITQPIIDGFHSWRFPALKRWLAKIEHFGFSF